MTPPSKAAGQHRACSAMALRHLEMGKVSAYEHACARAATWLRPHTSVEAAFAESLIGYQPPVVEKMLLHGEAEAARSLAELYEDTPTGPAFVEPT